MGECGTLLDVITLAQALGNASLYDLGGALLLTVGDAGVVFLEVADDMFCSVKAGGKLA